MILLKYIGATLTDKVSAPNGLFDLTVNSIPLHVMYNNKAMPEAPKFFHIGDGEICFPDCSANFNIHHGRIQMFCTPNGSTKMTILISPTHRFGHIPNASDLRCYQATGKMQVVQGVHPTIFTLNRIPVTMANFHIPNEFAISISKLSETPVRGAIGNKLYTVDFQHKKWIVQRKQRV